MTLDEAKKAQIKIMTKVLDYEHVTGHDAPPGSQVFRPKKAWLDADKLGPKTKLEDVDARRVIGVGISLAPKGKPKGYGIVFLCQRKSDINGPLVTRARKEYAPNAEVIFTGPVRLASKKRKSAKKKKQAATAQKTSTSKKKKKKKQSTAPVEPSPLLLRIGDEVERDDGTAAGSIGCFVDVAGSSEVYILSNNHVLADFDNGNPGDAIRCPSTGSSDTIAELVRAIPIEEGVTTNLVDAAIAKLLPNATAERNKVYDLPGYSPSTGKTISRQVVSNANVTQRVRKRGIGTPGYPGTKGMVWQDYATAGAWDSDDYVTWFLVSSQIVIYGTPNDFAGDGDSGAVAFNDDMHAVAMIFAISPDGGKQGGGLTYGNPMKVVLEKLNAAL